MSPPRLAFDLGHAAEAIAAAIAGDKAADVVKALDLAEALTNAAASGNPTSIAAALLPVVREALELAFGREAPAVVVADSVEVVDLRGLARAEGGGAP